MSNYYLDEFLDSIFSEELNDYMTNSQIVNILRVFEDKNKQLEQQLEQKDKEINALKKGKEETCKYFNCCTIHQVKEKYNKLKEKLEEKEKEIERLKQIVIDINKNNNQLRDSLSEYTKHNVPAVLLDRQIEELKTNQKQKTIEELENVLNNCFTGKCEMFYDIQKNRYALSERDREIIDFINNRIKELK